MPSRTLIALAVALPAAGGVIARCSALSGSSADASPVISGTRTPNESPASAPASSPVSAPSHLTAEAPTQAPFADPGLTARRQLYATVDGLLTSGELEKARKLLDEDVRLHGDELGPEWLDVEQSYRIIADCLEQPSPRTRARARAFAEVSQANALKARILSACQD